jgi:hypothetical protein
MTREYDGIANALTCLVTLAPYHRGDSPENVSKKHHINAEALFDTGAMRSVISEKAARDLRLVNVGECSVGTAGGLVIQPMYIVTFGFPNMIVVTGVEVTAAPLSDIDALIGMDIITLGDFAITHLRGKTVSTFQIPSTHHFDFCTD